MTRADGTKFYDLQPLFLGHGWIENSVSEYRQGNRKLSCLRGKEAAFPEKHFAAALMHLYVGAFSLVEIARMCSLTLAELGFLRTQIDFMMLVDALKASFTRHFRENLTLNEYTPHQYASISAEYAVFEELARNQIRVPLFKRMKQLAISISDKVDHDLPVDLYDLESFKKLFSFFVFEEYFLPALSKPSLQYLKRVAKEAVWKRLKADYGELDSLLCADLTRDRVKDELRTLFVFMKPH